MYKKNMKLYFTEYFKKQLRQIQKKFKNAKNDLLDGLNNLDLKNEINIGRGIYKLRIQSSDKNSGKSGGFRSYVYLYKKDNLLVPLCIYDKNQRVSISNNELNYYFARAIEELL
jgi:hypothetical protein